MIRRPTASCNVRAARRSLCFLCLPRTVPLVLVLGLFLAVPQVPVQAAAPALRLPRIFGDNMVLQRDMPVPVWGWAAPDEEVVVRIAGQEVKIKADAKGKWSARLAAIEAGGPHELSVTAGKNKIAFKNVLVGEVWVCSGQSNMQFGLSGAHDAKDAIAGADLPQIRHIAIANVNSKVPLEDPPPGAAWVVCHPRTAARFSAVAFFFGREIHKKLQVPVGLIHSSWGGTMIEPWTAPEGFASVSNLVPLAAAATKAEEQCRKDLSGMLDAIDAWSAGARRALADHGPLPLAPNPATLYQNGGPSGIYNAMIRPLVPYAIRGAIWYQGESNLADGQQGLLYKNKMEALIGGWRRVWAQGDFPFYYVQIAPYKYNANQPQSLPLLWMAQTAALEIPNTGMAVITDVGDEKDIHPRKKYEVGYRLALWALAKTYGQTNLVYSGPFFKSVKVEAGRLRLAFDHVGGGLASRNDQPLDWFEIAGSDGMFVPAKGEIDGDGDTVVVSAEQVPEPAEVRFGWNNTASPNLMNKEGLPASPFRAKREEPPGEPKPEPVQEEKHD